MGITDMNVKSMGQINFEAYAAAVSGETYDKKPIPPWDELTDQVRSGWNAGANAVIEHYDPDGELVDNFDDDSDDEDFGDGASG